MRRWTGATFAAVLLLVLAAAAAAGDIWYEDTNLGKAAGMPADFVEKFQRPETFQQASRYIRVYLMRANVLEQMDDQFFTALLGPYLRRNSIRLAINTGGANWTQARGREKAFDRDMELYRRMKRLGVDVHHISLQSVLSKPRQRGGDRDDYPLERRIADVIEYSKAAREIYPQAAIGIIDALPSHGADYRKPYRMLRDALAREKLALSYIHVDMPLEIPKEQRRGVTWPRLREVESYVEDELGLRFGVFTTSLGGRISAKAFHEGVLAALECYAGAGGTPADLIIASWFPHPRKTIPENAVGDDYPFMRTVLEYGRRLDEIKRAGAAVAQRSREPAWRALCTTP